MRSSRMEAWPTTPSVSQKKKTRTAEVTKCGSVCHSLPCKVGFIPFSPPIKIEHLMPSLATSHDAVIAAVIRSMSGALLTHCDIAGC